MIKKDSDNRMLHRICNFGHGQCHILIYSLNQKCINHLKFVSKEQLYTFTLLQNSINK